MGYQKIDPRPDQRQENLVKRTGGKKGGPSVTHSVQNVSLRSKENCRGKCVRDVCPRQKEEVSAKRGEVDAIVPDAGVFRLNVGYSKIKAVPAACFFVGQHQGKGEE